MYLRLVQPSRIPGPNPAVLARTLLPVPTYQDLPLAIAPTPLGLYYRKEVSEGPLTPYHLTPKMLLVVEVIQRN